MTLEELGRLTLKRYDVGSFEAVGSIFEPHASVCIGVQTSKGRYRLWRYHRFMTPELVELQHAMLQRLAERGVPAKRLVSGRDGRTWQDIDGQLVALFEWFGGWMPDLKSRRDVMALGELHGKWTLAMADFNPPISDWQELASQWRPRKLWAWVLPTAELPLVPKRMGFFAAVRDVENPPPHHERYLAQVRDTEARLERFADKARELRLADLPRGMNHGVFMLGHIDWELFVTNGDDFQYESRAADLGRMLYAIYDRNMPSYEAREQATLLCDTYREQVDLLADEVRALPLLAWGQALYYDVFHVLLYLAELEGPDRGEYLVAPRTEALIGERDRLERGFDELAQVVSKR